MKKILFLTIAVIIGVFLASDCYCYDIGNPSSYKITVQQLEGKRSDGVWENIFSLGMEIDIAAAGQNSSAATISGFLPAGDYVNFRIYVSETIKYTGSITVGATTHYTKANGNITLTGSDTDAASTRTWPVGWPTSLPNVSFTISSSTWSSSWPAREVTANLNLGANKAGGDSDDYFIVTSANDLTTPITVNSNSEVNIAYYFDTEETLIYTAFGGGIMFFLPPKEGTKFEITVDGSTFTIDKSNMAVDF